MKYKMIIFDADDTLYDFAKSEEFAFYLALRDMNIEIVEEYLDTYVKINLKIWNEFEAGRITQEDLKVERFRRFLKETGLNSDPEALSDSFTNNLLRASFLFEGAMELIEKLSKKYRLVMITNGLTEVQNHRIRGHKIAEFFEKVIISGEIGYAKPDPMIFSEGLKDLKPVEKSEILIVGDGLTSDISGGINYGIDTCWFNPKHKKNHTNYKPTYEINRYEDLEKILLD